MLKNILFLLLLSTLFSCKKKVEKIKPSVENISESIYASGTLKSKDQYQAFSAVNGIVKNVYVKEGDTVKKGALILSISNEVQKLNKENAALTAGFSDFNANQGKLNDANAAIALAKNKMQNDNLLYSRQQNLWDQQIGSKMELEQRELAYKSSKIAYESAITKYNDLKRQLTYTSEQAKKALSISQNTESDFNLKSEINGVVYSLSKSKGEIVGTQTPIAIIGDSKNFILEMQVDEYDILKIRTGMIVYVTMDSYKGKVFEATISKINPYMNERNKTFTVEAIFNNPPDLLYPNISFEANIVINKKENALLIPRSYVQNDSIVMKANGEKVVIKTGLKDYNKIEVLSGITKEDELQKIKE